jgi:hypothetical protein
MNDAKARQFGDKIAATAIVNNAVVRCTHLGLPINHDNVILCIGDFFDPGDADFTGVIVEIEHMMDITIGTLEDRRRSV